MIQNRRSKVIGLTGGIATGKSTVTQLLRTKGYTVIDADQIAREVVEVGKKAYNDIIEVFGSQILHSDLTINREELGHIVFNDERSRQKLNKIVHGQVVKEIIQRLEKHRDESIVFIDIPLLIEEMERLEATGLRFDSIWVVYANEALQLERLMKRDHLEEEAAYKRMGAQMPVDEKVKYADAVIDNTKGIEELSLTIDSLIESIE